MSAGEKVMLLELMESLCDSAGIAHDDERRRVVRRMREQNRDARLEQCPNSECRRLVRDMLWHPAADNRNCCPHCGTSILRASGTQPLTERTHRL